MHIHDISPGSYSPCLLSNWSCSSFLCFFLTVGLMKDGVRWLCCSVRRTAGLRDREPGRLDHARPGAAGDSGARHQQGLQLLGERQRRAGLESPAQPAGPAAPSSSRAARAGEPGCRRCGLKQILRLERLHRQQHRQRSHCQTYATRQRR